MMLHERCVCVCVCSEAILPLLLCVTVLFAAAAVMVHIWRSVSDGELTSDLISLTFSQPAERNVISVLHSFDQQGAVRGQRHGDDCPLLLFTT